MKKRTLSLKKKFPWLYYISREEFIHPYIIFNKINCYLHNEQSRLYLFPLTCSFQLLMHMNENSTTTNNKHTILDKIWHTATEFRKIFVIGENAHLKEYNCTNFIKTNDNDLWNSKQKDQSFYIKVSFFCLHILSRLSSSFFNGTFTLYSRVYDLWI